jgi:hypothetical protein
MSHNFNLTTYCRTQAARCAAAAAHAGHVGVKDAYLNLEQAWLHLDPGSESDPTSSASNTAIPRKKFRTRPPRAVS